MKRLWSIDCLRGIAVMLVMLGHSDLGELRGPLQAVEPIALSGGTGVTLFVVISGFSIHLRWADKTAGAEPFPVAAFWRRRFVRLYPTYWAALAVCLAMLAITDGLDAFDRPGPFAWDGRQPGWLVVLNHLTVIGSNVVPAQFIARSWSLALEEQLYAGYSLLQRAGRFRPTRLVVPTAALSIATILVAQAIGDWEPLTLPEASQGPPLWQLIVTFQVPVLAFAWVLGAWLAEWHVGRLTLPRWFADPRVAAALLATAIGLRYVGATVGPFTPSDAVIAVLFALGYACLVAWLVDREHHRGAAPGVLAPVARVGLWSYSVYLLHQPFFHLVEERTALAPRLAVPLGWALALAASGLFFHVVERHFIRRAAGRREPPGTTPPTPAPEQTRP